MSLIKSYNSKPKEQEIVKRGYVLHLPYKRKRGEIRERKSEKIVQIAKNILQGDEGCRKN